MIKPSKNSLKIYGKFIYILLAVFIVSTTTIAQIKSLIPPSLPQNEETLLKDARNTEPEFAATLSGRINVQPPVHISSVHALKIDPKDPGPLSVKTTIPNLGGFYGLLGGVMEWTSSPGTAKARFTDKNGE